jgi:phospholipid/cholesterol/gamma-HCH transport system substrate-binding protein
MSRVARLGAFIVGTLAILAAGVFIIGSKQYLFRPTYQLRTQFDNVAGLAQGADVQVGGVHSGTVLSIQLPHKPGDKITVLMNLEKSTREIIKQDSVATIETQGMLGDQFIAITFGSAGQADVKDGQTIQSEPPLMMADMLKKANGMLDTGQQAVQNLTVATGHIASVSTKIDQGNGTVGALINDKQLYNNLQQSTASLHDTMLHAQTGVTNFEENMEAMKHNFLLSGYFKKRGYEDSGELEANRIASLPDAQPTKTFSFPAKQLFDARDSAKLKNQKSLKEGGDFLAGNQFGFAVVVVSSGMDGDSKKSLTLTEARAMVVREYLVQNFGFDDAQLKTLGMGKQSGANLDAEWGSVQLLIFPPGTPMPADKTPPADTSTKREPGSAQTTHSASSQKP